MKMDTWLGYQLSSAELCVLLDFSGEEMIPGLPNMEPSTADLEKACDFLLEKGLIYYVGGEVVPDQTVRGLIHEMAVSENVMVLDDRNKMVAVYPGHKCRVMLIRGAAQGWRLLSLQTMEEARTFAESFVEAVEGHLRVSVISGTEKKFSGRCGEEWRRVFPKIWETYIGEDNPDENRDMMEEEADYGNDTY